MAEFVAPGPPGFVWGPHGLLDAAIKQIEIRPRYLDVTSVFDSERRFLPAKSELRGVFISLDEVELGSVCWMRLWIPTDPMRHDMGLFEVLVSEWRQETNGLHYVFRQVSESVFPPFSWNADRLGKVVAFEQAIRDDSGIIGIYADWCADYGWEARENELRQRMKADEIRRDMLAEMSYQRDLKILRSWPDH